jgi:hypothetical protein
MHAQQALANFDEVRAYLTGRMGWMLALLNQNLLGDVD